MHAVGETVFRLETITGFLFTIDYLWEAKKAYVKRAYWLDENSEGFILINSQIPTVDITCVLQIFLPSVTEKQEIGKDPSGDKLTLQWLVADMFHFENVGFSKTVNNCEKYLVCADCEMGPIGWTNVTNKSEIYVAAERVDYANS